MQLRRRPMRTVPSLVTLALAACAACSSQRLPARIAGPALPLPELDGAPNSARAWSYDREMLEPMRGLARAVSMDSTVPKPLKYMLVAVVASRTGCHY